MLAPTPTPPGPLSTPATGVFRTARQYLRGSLVSFLQLVPLAQLVALRIRVCEWVTSRVLSGLHRAAGDRLLRLLCPALVGVGHRKHVAESVQSQGNDATAVPEPEARDRAPPRVVAGRPFLFH